MADIRINQLPLATGPTAPMQSDFVPLDGTNTRKATLLSLADVINPPASQAEAEAGTDAVKRMTPLTTAQAIDAKVSTAGISGAYADLTGKPTLGNSSALNVGTSSGTVAAGDDSRIVNAIQPLTTFNSRNRVVRGAGISDALWNSRIGDFANGERAPHFVWNDPSTSDLVAGFNSGQQVWVGDNPTATPGAGHAAASTLVVTNGRNRDALYGQNILVGFSNSGTGYNDGFLCGLEINVYADFAGTVSDAFVGGNRKNGLELTSQGSVGRVTAAAMIWSADNTGAAWWSEGLAISRSVNTGIRFAKNPGGSTDGINAFQVAAIHDESGSTNVLLISNSHSAALRLNASAAVDRIVDLSGNPTINTFVLGKTTSATSLLFKNNASFGFDLTIDSGVSAGVVQSSSITFSDRGSGRWQIIRNNGNALNFFHLGSGTNAISMDGNTTDGVIIRVGGAEKRITVGAVDSGGSGFRMLRVPN